MSAAHITPAEVVIHSRRSSAPIRSTLSRRIEGRMYSWVSPFERWEDDHYTPHHLHHVAHSTEKTFEIVTELHGYSASEVFVDLHRGQAIILLSRQAMDEVDALTEYYCEVPIPNDTRQDGATLEVTANLLIVRLQKYPPVLRWLMPTLHRWLRLHP